MGFKNRIIKRIICVAVAAVLAVSISGCMTEDEIFDLHMGEVCVPNGAGGEMWVPLYENLPVSTLRAEEFYDDGAFINYTGEEYIAQRGVDVSEHQRSIDWAAVKGDGVEFAIIRAGYRGCSEGQLNEDMYFRQNIEGALFQGIEVGVYFFSQAINTEEAVEEALYLIDLIKDYNVTLPVFYDWELVTNIGETRCDELTGIELTENCLAFCSTIERHGYRAGVYFYRALGYRDYELGSLSDYVFWAAAPGKTPDFYYKHSIWQYSFTAQINGIDGPTDLDLMFIEKQQEAEQTPDQGAQQTGDGSISIKPPAVTVSEG